MLALSGVWEGDLAAENLSVESREVVGRFWVKQMEKLQLINMEVANRLHHGQLGHHLCKFLLRGTTFMKTVLQRNIDLLLKFLHLLSIC